MKSIAPYLGFFAGVVIVAWMLGSADPIAPAIVEARAEESAGPIQMQVIDQGMSAVLKLVAGATIASVLGFLAVEGSKWYRRYTFEQNTRRFRGRGQNGQGRAQPRQSLPKLSREDLILAMLGDRINTKRVRRQEVDDVELDL